MSAYTIDDMNVYGSKILPIFRFFSISLTAWYTYEWHTVPCLWFHNALNKNLFRNSSY